MTVPDLAGGPVEVMLWKHYSEYYSGTETAGARTARNRMLIGRSLATQCGQIYGDTIINHFRIEQSTLSQTQIESMIVNNATYNMDCAYYESAFTFSSGTETDSLGGSLSISTVGIIDVPGDGNGFEVDETDTVILENVATGSRMFFSVQIVFTGEFVDGDIIILRTPSSSKSFSKSGNSLANGGDLFTGFSNNGNDWVLSVGILHYNFHHALPLENYVDF